MYYFIGTYLQDIQLGNIPDITIESYTNLLEKNLTSHDRKEWIALQRSFNEQVDYFPLAEGFLKTFLMHEQAVRLILAALRSKKWGKPILPELEFEDPSDELVASILAQKDAKTFEPPNEYAELKTIYEKFSDSPLELHQAILSYRFQKVKEWIGLQTFTLDRLLAYYVQLILAFKWVQLDGEKGRKIINSLVQEI